MGSEPARPDTARRAHYRPSAAPEAVRRGALGRPCGAAQRLCVVRAARVRCHLDRRRSAGSRLRFLPQHLALEGYLALHFGGPEVAWEEWSRRAIAQGLSPRCEAAYVGAEVPGLDEGCASSRSIPVSAVC